MLLLLVLFNHRLTLMEQIHNQIYNNHKNSVLIENIGSCISNFPNLKITAFNLRGIPLLFLEGEIIT